MKKHKLRWIAAIAALLLILSFILPGLANADTAWTQRQTQAHQIAQTAREMGLPETDPIITEAQAIWTQEAIPIYTDNDATMIAKVLYNEAKGVKSTTENACIVWCVLNRVDASGKTISEVVTAKNQFAYSSGAPVRDDLLSLAYDVLGRWQSEKNGYIGVGRVLPKGYTYYTGNGRHNIFRNQYKGGTAWNYSLPSPYTN
jgi:hypothetical protein